MIRIKKIFLFDKNRAQRELGFFFDLLWVLFILFVAGNETSVDWVEVQFRLQRTKDENAISGLFFLNVLSS